MHPDFSSVLPKPSGHSKRLLSCESGSPRSLSSVRTQPRAGGGKGCGERTASAHPCPLAGPQPRTPAGRAFADRSQVPAARAAVSPEPPLPLHLRQAPPRRYRDGEHKEPRPHARPFPMEEKLRCTRVQTRTRPARAGEGISYLSPRCYSWPPPIHPPMEVWPAPAPRWVPRPPARSGCTHCLTARAQRLQGPAAAAAAGTETAAAAAAAPAGVSQTGAAKPHRPY